MKRLACSALLCFVLVTGCTSTGGRVPVAQTAPSGEPTASLQAIHGDGFVGSRYETNSPVSEAGVTVILKDGQPASAQPFAVLSLLARLKPGMKSYAVIYEQPIGNARPNESVSPPGFWSERKQVTAVYTWVPRGRQVLISRGPGGPHEYASDVDTAALKAVGSGWRLPPPFVKAL